MSSEMREILQARQAALVSVRAELANLKKCVATIVATDNLRIAAKPPRVGLVVSNSMEANELRLHADQLLTRIQADYPQYTELKIQVRSKN